MEAFHDQIEASYEEGAEALAYLREIIAEQIMKNQIEEKEAQQRKENDITNAKFYPSFMLYPIFKPIKNLELLEHRTQLAFQYIHDIKHKKVEFNKQKFLSSNLTYFTSIVWMLKSEIDQGHQVVGVLMKIGESSKTSVHVDIVSREHRLWIKVKSRDADTLLAIHLGQSSEKCMSEKIPKLLNKAAEYSVHFEPIHVAIKFACGVPKELKDALESFDHVHVDGNINRKLNIPKDIYPHQPQQVMLDVSTAIVMVADEAQSTDTLVQLKKFYENKKVSICECTKKHLLALLERGGSESERHRTNEFLQNITIVADDMDEAFKSFSRRRVKEMHRIIFGTAFKKKALILTSNQLLIKQLMKKGIYFSFLVHPTYTLTHFKRSRWNTPKHLKGKGCALKKASREAELKQLGDQKRCTLINES
mmetsp:Transcript_3731/g.5516  ORF Transcript_3731/g.5516 Transcript_3731/m.5516 type:complete len:420 (+) Transcript_3731:1-1260(+)